MGPISASLRPRKTASFKEILQHWRAGASPASRDRGAKFKSGGQRFSLKSEGFFWPKSQIFRPKAGDLQKKRSSPKSEGFFWPKSQIFRPKAGDLQKVKRKKVLTKIRRLFLAEIASFNVFSAEKHQLLPPKKIPWGARKKIRGAKTKIGGALPLLPPRWRRACWPVFGNTVFDSSVARGGGGVIVYSP